MKNSLFAVILILLVISGSFNCLWSFQGADSLDYNMKELEEMMKELSPEERKQVEDAMGMAKEMQDNGMLDNIPTSENNLSIPPRQDKILGEIPTLSSEQQYSDYLSGLLGKCTANINPAIISEVDGFFSSNSGNMGNLVNFGPTLLMQKKPVAAIYAAIKMAKLHPEIVLLQNNMAVILHQTGNPQISVPILQYLLIKNNYPLILNNLAQSYLSLGDTASARMHFMGCLQKDPDNPESNCGIGLIESEEGNISEATPYIIKALKNGYSETADELMKKHKMDIKFSDIKQSVPEYFNPQKYKPIPPASKMEEVETTMALRNELHELTRLWMQRKQQINEEQNNKSDSENVRQVMSGYFGLNINTPYAKKSQLMVNLLGIEYYEFITSVDKNEYIAAMEKHHEKFTNLSSKKGFDNEDCLKQIEYLNAYLLESKKIHEDYQQKTLPKIYDWVNQSLYWQHFLCKEGQYKVNFVNYVADFFEAIHGYDELQHLPEFIARYCKDAKEPDKVKTPADTLSEPDCPVRVEIPLGAAKVKWDCKGYEIEGGELIMGGYEKEYKTGEVTLFLGLGAELFGKGVGIGGIEGGAKGGVFIKFGKGLTILDFGNKGEAGFDVGVGPFINETKLTGVMGMQSGLKLEKTIMGEKSTVYDSEKPEEQINPEIHIFNK